MVFTVEIPNGHPGNPQLLILPCPEFPASHLAACSSPFSSCEWFYSDSRPSSFCSWLAIAHSCSQSTCLQGPDNHLGTRSRGSHYLSYYMPEPNVQSPGRHVSWDTTWTISVASQGVLLLPALFHSPCPVSVRISRLGPFPLLAELCLASHSPYFSLSIPARQSGR